MAEKTGAAKVSGAKAETKPAAKKTEPTLKSICEKRAKELYGGKYPDIIEERLKKELQKIKDGKTEPVYHEARELSLLARKADMPLTFRNTMAGSLVAFLSEINYVNPLPAHYYCENCDYTEFPDVERNIRECGANLPPKLCPKCGKSLKKDGFDIPYEVCFSHPTDETQTIVVESVREFFEDVLPKKYQVVPEDELVKYGFETTERKRFQDMQEVENMEYRVLYGAGVPGKRLYTKHYIAGKGQAAQKLVGVRNPNFEFLHRLEKRTKVRAKEAAFDDAKTMTFFRSNHALGMAYDSAVPFPFGTLGVPFFGTDTGVMLLKEISPVRYGQLVRMIGLTLGRGTWTDNGEHKIREENAKIEDLVTSRDDIIHYLREYEVPDGIILEVVKNITIGRGLFQNLERELYARDVPDGFIDSCRRIKYLFPRTQAVFQCGLAWQLAWFKANYPQDFYGAFFDTFASDEMKETVRSGRLRVTELCEKYDPAVAQDLGLKRLVEFPILHVALEMYERGYSYL